MSINTLGIDPTRTTLLRRQWCHAVDMRFLALGHAITQLIEHQNALGITSNTRWAYETDTEKLGQFKIWLQIQINQHILSQRQADSWFTDYVSKAYAKGIARSFEDVRSLGRSQAYYNKRLDFYLGSRAEFLSSSFSRPASQSRIELLGSRTFSELKGVTDAMSQQMTRTLVDGMAQGISPREVAVNLNRDVANIGIMRARRVARTETIRAHASGQLQSLRDLGVDQIGVAVELSTAGDNKVCPRCRLLNGIVLTPDEAEGLIPVHDECRCCFQPANIGEPTQGQVRSRSRIMEALRKATPAQVKLSKQLQRKRRVWGSGFDPSKISKVRPRRSV